MEFRLSKKQPAWMRKPKEQTHKFDRNKSHLITSNRLKDRQMDKIKPDDKDADTTGASGETFRIDIGRDFSFNISELMADGVRTAFYKGGTLSRASDSPENEKRRGLERAESEAREPIKQYLFEGSPDVEWDDVIGNEDARQALIAAIEHGIKHPDLYKHYGKKPSKGVLLSGPPGCGKTMLAKAAATIVAKLHGLDAKKSRFIKINGPEIQTPYVGQTEAIIRRIFAYAKAYKALHGHALTIFIDEADALLPSRDGRGGRPTLPWEETQVAAFLAEMDGLDDSGAFIMLATNRPHAIDSAALRDGRCDRKITVVRPTRIAATTIFNRSMTGVPLATGCHSLPALTEVVIENFYSPLRKLVKIVHSKGTDFLTLGDTVNGAMIVGLVERAKESALLRDIAAGGLPTGVSSFDFDVAVDALTKENVGTVDHYALMEFCQRTGIDQISVEAITADRKIPEIKRAGLH